MKVNYSKNSDYHTQRNNKNIPGDTCNVTAAVMAIKQAGWTVPERKGIQPEDALWDVLRTAESYDYQKRAARWSVGWYPPEQVHTCLEWGINKWMGQEIDEFHERATKDQIYDHLKAKGGVVLSGNFPLDRGELGHIVSVAGWVGIDTVDEVVRWIIDDPYGNWNEQYSDIRGNDTLISADDFDRIFLRSGHLWAHLVRPYAA